MPMSWDRSESVQCFTWALPGLTSREHRLVRFPFAVLPKHFCLPETFDFMFQLFGWSLKCMFLGQFPSSRHDGTPFEEGYRKALCGQELGFRALLVEVKGDWEFFSDILHLPRWNNVEGICFLCKATREHLSQCDLSAPWRQEDMRMNHHTLVHRLLSTKSALSPIWQFPLFKMVCLKLDWLHIADHGVTACLAGSILCLFVDPPGMPGFGPTIEDRRLTLWNMLLHFYKEQG